jgi:hypothetical protein
LTGYVLLATRTAKRSGVSALGAVQGNGQVQRAGTVSMLTLPGCRTLIQERLPSKGPEETGTPIPPCVLPFIEGGQTLEGKDLMRQCGRLFLANLPVFIPWPGNSQGPGGESLLLVRSPFFHACTAAARHDRPCHPSFTGTTEQPSPNTPGEKTRHRRSRLPAETPGVFFCQKAGS